MPDDSKPTTKTAKTVAKSTAAKPAVSPADSSEAIPKKDTKALKIVLIVVGVLFALGVIGTILLIVFFNNVFDDATDGININDGSVTVQTDDGTARTSVGENAKLAEGFPSDVPIYEPSSLMASTKVDNASYSAIAKTATSVADVTSYYRTQMAEKGWVSQLDSAADDGSLLTFEKDNRTASVVITLSEDEASKEKTGFVVSVTTGE